MPYSRKYAIIMLTLLLAFSFHLPVYAQSSDQEKPRNVILFIGDGMGPNQVKAAQVYAREVLNRELVIGSINISGTTTTHSASSKVTDSAAAATAIYSGFKTKNGQLNVLPDGTTAEGIGMAAKKAGLSVGIVSTARITDATPAALYAISSNRGSHNEIAVQLPDFMADVVLGVGSKHFAPSSHKGSDRKDETDVIALMKEKGYEYVENLKELKAVQPGQIQRLFGMFSSGDMPFAIDRKNNPGLSHMPTLADMTSAAITMVEKNPKGFLLVVEGGRIDHACHANDIKTMIEETLEFDDAVAVGLKFQKTHPETLVIVTADHETGGLKRLGEGEFSMDPKALEVITRSLGHVEDKIRRHPDQIRNQLKAAGFELTPEESELLESYMAKASEDKLAGKNAADKSAKHDKSGSLRALSKITSQRSKIEWASNGHTDHHIITRAIGPGAKTFEGNYDNTDIAIKIARLLNLSIPALKEKKASRLLTIPAMAYYFQKSEKACHGIALG